jgi:hypothetical protein
MGVLRRAYVEVLPDTDGFDSALTAKLKAADPGGKSGKLVGKQLGGQLNLALARLDLPAIDIKADPKTALAALEAVEAKLHAMSGDAATVEVKVQTEKALGQLARFRKQLGDVGDQGGEEAATGFAARFGARLGPLMANVAAAPPVLAGGALIGAALAPTMAAAIGAGLAAGAGAGAIIGGLKLISKDPQVAAAGKSIGQRFSAGVTSEAETFKVPVLAALAQVDAFASRTVPKIGEMFRNTSPAVEGLTGSILRTGDALADSLVKATSRSAGPLAALGNGVEQIGTEFAHMIDTLSRRSPEGVSAIDDIAGAATRAVRATTAIVDGAAKVKGWSDTVDGAIDKGRAWVEDNSAIGKSLKGVGINLDLTADGYKAGSAAADLYRLGVIGNSKSLNNYDHWLKETSSSLGAVTGATAAAEKPQRALVGTLSNADKAALGERNAMVALSNQLRAQTDPAFALIEAQKSLKTAQDRAAAATKQHGKNSDEARTATRQLALAAIDLQGKAGALSSSFNGKLSPAMRDAFKAAGLTKSQINAVAAEFRNAKRDGDRYSKKYQANVTISGQVKVDSELARLLAVQAALRSGNPLTAGVVNKAMRDVLGPQINRAKGGPINGPGTETSDDIPAMLSKNEWVIQAKSARKIGRAGMEYLNKYGELPVGLAGGGQVGMPFPTTARMTRIPSLAEVKSKVALPMGSFGKWPSSPGAQRGDSGVWRKILALVKASGIPYKFGNAYRPGDPLWHGSGRAIDFMGYNQNRLANFFMARQSKVLELIHRTKTRDYGITRGHYNAMPHQWPLHRNHLHIAMAGGGVINEPVMGVGKSGRSYSFGENGPETVTPGVGGRNTYNINIAVPVGAHPAEVGRQTVNAIQAFERSNGARWRQ